MNSTPVTERDRLRGDLSTSWYDVAMVALIGGPQRAACLDWLTGQRHPDGTWGADRTLSWQDTYVSTYAAAAAFHAAGHTTLAQESANALLGIRTDTAGCETLTFGGLVDTLDRITAYIGWQIPRHPDEVVRLIHEECRRWEKCSAGDSATTRSSPSPATAPSGSSALATWTSCGS